ncbi:inositol-tetrakisphosphate 1-kinase 1-like [Coffea arabica]|uniref:inositol-1,3,4-trisphosphate 5/6-kinase n=1 Tax=Coffea arabica TaxID=13443 RepID=A0A6P6U019_COFAR|nr:inositol-tetrakisphosphate 1-kinase 5-like [Coffea arabica]
MNLINFLNHQQLTLGIESLLLSTRALTSMTPSPVPAASPHHALDMPFNIYKEVLLIFPGQFQSDFSKQATFFYSDLQAGCGIISRFFVIFGLPSPLEFSVITKPLLADGIASSHRMSLVFNQQGLKQLKEEEEEALFVLQKFVNHGGGVFKVYVVGNYVQCVKRRSLPNNLMDDDDDKPLGRLEASHRNLLTYSQVSNLTAAAASFSSSSKNNDEQQQEDVKEEEATAQMSPVSFLTCLAKALRNALGLHLFNFDIIRDSRSGNRYLVIDINYFLGYAKMPSYKTVIDILEVTYSY